MINAKRDLTDVLNEKNELISQLNDKEMETYSIKKNMDIGDVVSPSNQVDEFKASKLKSELSLQQFHNTKLQKEVNQKSSQSSQA